ncbi:hypothetical protein F4810DRAFT_668680 [Camillea tinctor]|nr:hypothetical protein F4810DRAFT_668680 [Camillea tinctor]
MYFLSIDQKLDQENQLINWYIPCLVRNLHLSILVVLELGTCCSQVSDSFFFPFPVLVLAHILFSSLFLLTNKLLTDLTYYVQPVPPIHSPIYPLFPFSPPSLYFLSLLRIKRYHQHSPTHVDKQQQ